MIEIKEKKKIEKEHNQKKKKENVEFNFRNALEASLHTFSPIGSLQHNLQYEDNNSKKEEEEEE